MCPSPASTRNSLLVAFPRHVYAIRRFGEAFQRRGAPLRVVSPGELVPVLVDGSVSAIGIERPDAVIHTWWGARGPSSLVLAAWEVAGTLVANGVAATQLTGDKYLASLRLAAAGLPQLPCAITTEAAADRVAAERLGYPCVAKPLGGSSGEHTFLLRSPADLALVAAARPFDGVPFLLQPFVAEAGGTDRRLFVLERRVLGAIERHAPSGDFRSNVAQGGRATGITPTADEVAIASEAVRALGLDYGGVDVIATRGGPVVLEVNGEPQFEAVETHARVDVAGEIVDWLLARCAD
jgi:ribosomal protein S6--L-glutamate ligase